MRLHPYQALLISLALFSAGLLLALMFLQHGNAEAPGPVTFLTPF